jgi:hypothetical protein
MIQNMSVSFKDISLPSRIKNVSSAYWLKSVSSSLIVIPWISGLNFWGLNFL